MRKKIYSILLVVVIFCLVLSSFSGCDNEDYYKVDPNAENLVSISEGTKLQTIDGFGASSAWWSQIVGGGDKIDEVAKLLYSEDGLAMNIYRYNIGGGSKDIWTYDEHDRMTESFLTVDDSFDYKNATTEELYNYVSDSNNYDFTKDENAQKMLEKSYSYGCIDQLVLFVNSPHYILTNNNYTHCLDDKTNNLNSENYAAFAKYLMNILKYFVVDKNYDVRYLSPINEPQWDWNNNDENKQEGCYYSPEACAACLDVVYDELKEFNATYNKNVKLDAFESGNWNTKTSGTASYITDYLDAMKEYEYFEELEHVSFHSYSSPGSATVRNTFMSKTEEYNIQVAITEYCQMSSGYDSTFGTAQFLSLVMSYDMSILHSSEWSWWIAVSNKDTYNYNDGLIYTNWWKTDDIAISPRYYAMQHYSKFVNSGAQYVDVKISNKVSQLTVTEKSPLTYFYNNGDAKGNYTEDLYNVFIQDDGSVVIVYSNVTPHDYTWNFADQYKIFEAYTSDGNEYMKKTEGEFSGVYTFKENTITTLILK